MRPVDLAFQILELIGSHQPIGVGELSRLADLPKSTAQRTLQALAHTGWIAPSEGERATWALTTRAMVFCGRPTRPQSILRGLALPVMEELRRATEETIHLSWRHAARLVLLERLDGIKPVRYFFPYGGVSTLHATASGTAILAALPANERDEYLKLPLAAVTARTLITPEAVRQAIDEVRRSGYATSEGGNVIDVSAVGAAIVDATGQPIAAVSVSAPAERLSADLIAHYGPIVADAARRISLGLRAHGG